MQSALIWDYPTRGCEGASVGTYSWFVPLMFVPGLFLSGSGTNGHSLPIPAMTTQARITIAKPCQALAMPNVAVQGKCKILATRPMILDFRPPTKKIWGGIKGKMWDSQIFSKILGIIIIMNIFRHHPIFWSPL